MIFEPQATWLFEFELIEYIYIFIFEKFGNHMYGEVALRVATTGILEYVVAEYRFVLLVVQRPWQEIRVPTTLLLNVVLSTMYWGTNTSAHITSYIRAL